jgi:hypothetical protein
MAADPIPLVILESPFAGPTPEARDRNLRYARACLRDALERGEAPLASHLLYTQPGVLDDDKPDERAKGIAAGLAWGRSAGASVVYLDQGLSGGMRLGVEAAVKGYRTLCFRRLWPRIELVYGPGVDPQLDDPDPNLKGLIGFPLPAPLFDSLLPGAPPPPPLVVLRGPALQEAPAIPGQAGLLDIAGPAPAVQPGERKPGRKWCTMHNRPMGDCVDLGVEH